MRTNSEQVPAALKKTSVPDHCLAAAKLVWVPEVEIDIRKMYSLLIERGLCICNRDLRRIVENILQLNVTAPHELWFRTLLCAPANDHEIWQEIPHRLFPRIQPVLRQIAFQILISNVCDHDQLLCWSAGSRQRNIFYVTWKREPYALVMRQDTPRVWVCKLVPVGSETYRAGDAVFTPMLPLLTYAVR